MAKTVLVEVPEELAGAVKRFLQEVEGAMPETRGGRAVDVASYEQAVEQSAAGLEQEAMRRLLQALDVDAPHVIIHGKPYTRVGRYEAPYETKAGPVRVLRSVYRKDGERTSKSVDAVSLRAGVVEDGWLPGTARAMAFLLQQGTSREAEKTARELGRPPYSRSSFERVGHAVGAVYEVLHAQVEDTRLQGVRGAAGGQERQRGPGPRQRPHGGARQEARGAPTPGRAQEARREELPPGLCGDRHPA